ncbi:MAG: dockerin type I repeat-containing protein [Ruminococcus sp.]|nr:dockerin type I repeat-containing protein [Ruminococcus sp.]
MKRILSVFLLAVMLFSALPLSAFAAADEIIDSIGAFSLYEPLDGETPSKKLSGIVEWSYQFVSISWTEDETGRKMSDSDKFKGGYHYSYAIVLEAKDGYAFDPTQRLKVNGDGVHSFFYIESADIYTDHVTVRNSILCRYAINAVHVTVTPPVAGQTPSYEVGLPEDAHYILDSRESKYEEVINGVYWSDAETDEWLKPTDRFAAGKKYKVNITFRVENENYYMDLYSYSSTVNDIHGVNLVGYNSYTEGIKFTFTCPAADTKYSLTVDMTSYLSESDPVTAKLIQNGSEKKSLSGVGGTIIFGNVSAGSYTLRVSKKNHVTRDYSITVSGNMTKEVKICPTGDANMNGAVQANDAMLAYRSSTNKYTFTDSYAKQCADANGNGTVQANDAMLIYRQSLGKHTLF